MKKLKDNSAISEVRCARHRISARFSHDPKRLTARYAKLETKLTKTKRYRIVRDMPPSDS